VCRLSHESELLRRRTTEPRPEEAKYLASAVFVANMVSHRQARVWRYVEEGSLLKLKSYLRKHRDLDVNFTQGKRQRSPLQLACSLEDDAVLRLLLKHGADVLQRDLKGDTALHIAANRALKHGKTGEEKEDFYSINMHDHSWCLLNSAVEKLPVFFCLLQVYDDLVVPLKKICPEALNVPNRAGVTPLDLLNWMKPSEVNDCLKLSHHLVQVQLTIKLSTRRCLGGKQKKTLLLNKKCSTNHTLCC